MEQVTSAEQRPDDPKACLCLSRSWLLCAEAGVYAGAIRLFLPLPLFPCILFLERRTNNRA